MFNGQLKDGKTVEIYNFNELSKESQEKVKKRIRDNIVSDMVYDRTPSDYVCSGFGDIMPGYPYWEMEEFFYTVENDEITAVRVSMTISSGMIEMLDEDDKEYFRQKYHTSEYTQSDTLNITYLDGVTKPQFYIPKFEWVRSWGESKGQPFAHSEEFITEFLERIRNHCSILEQINAKALENVKESVEDQYAEALDELNSVQFTTIEEYTKAQDKNTYARAYLADGTGLYYSAGSFYMYSD